MVFDRKFMLFLLMMKMIMCIFFFIDGFLIKLGVFVDVFELSLNYKDFSFKDYFIYI